jgi:hypothetical protein
LIKSLNKENKKVPTRIYKTFQEKSIKKEKIKRAKILEKRPGTILKNSKTIRTLLAGQKQFM